MDIFLLFIQFLFKMIPTVLILSYFYKEDFHCSKPVAKSLIIIFVLVSLLYYYLETYIFITNNYLTQIASSSICILIFTLIANIAIKKSFFEILFAVLFSKTYTDSVSLLVWTYTTNSVVDIQTPSYFQNIIYFQLIVTLLTLPFLYFFASNFITPLINRSMKYWNYLWIIAYSFFLIYRISIYPNLISFIDELKQGLLLLPFVWIIALYFCYYATFKMLTETIKNEQLSDQLRLSALHTDMQKKEFQSIYENMEQVRTARHDLRHHLLALRGLAEKQDDEAIQSYIDKLMQSVMQTDLEPVCNNLIVDAIIRHYLGAAQKKNISISIACDLPFDLSVLENDLCTTLGNLLENAYEACIRQKTGEKFIHLKIGNISKNMLAIYVKNSFDGEIRKKDSIFYSSKRDSEGIGILSVKNIVNKYTGVSKFEHSNGIFQVSILLNYPFSF